MRNVNVIGTSGTGKSTFAHALAVKLDLRYIEMDSIHWKNDWQSLSDREFFATLTKALCQSGWVLDGNYTRTIFIKWQQVDTVIWLNYPFYLVLYRAIRRAIIRIVTREQLWQTNNIETLSKLVSKDSIIWWTLSTYNKNKILIRQLMQDPRYSYINFIEINSPQQARQFLANLN